jgi:Arc/MetJ-type ribon-helix-helix transcriptional regulator
MTTQSHLLIKAEIAPLRLYAKIARNDRPRGFPMPDTEKITINMSAVDLGKVELLVQEGLYSNRTDFIRTAIRNQLDRHTLEIQQSVTRHSYVIGVLTYDLADLEKARSKGERLDLKVLGLLHIAKDVTPELAREVIVSIRLLGIFQASEAVKEALSDRMR